jgi:hypothetical protein
MRRILTALTVLATAAVLVSSSGCVHCTEYTPGTKIAAAPGAFGAPQKGGGPETRQSK